MSGNGRRRPPRPRVEIRQATASPDEAAAVAAAIEQLLHDTAPPAVAAPAVDPWLRTGLYEAAGVEGAGPTPWGDPEPWGRA